MLYYGTVIQGFHNTAIKVSERSLLSLFGCLITDNYGNLGGGIYSEGGVSIHDDSVISYNSAAKGGGIYIANGNLSASSFHGMAYPDAVVFGSNSADHGGAIYFGGKEPATLGFQNAGSFRNNKAKKDGGAIYADVESNLTVMFMAFGGMIANDFHKNSAGGNGGSIFVRNSGGEVTFYSFHSSQRNNTAGGNGGAMYFDVETDSESQIYISSVTTNENIANNGGAIFIKGEPKYLSVYGAFTDNEAKAGTLIDDELALFYADSIDTSQVSDHVKSDGTQGTHLINNHDLSFKQVETETPEIVIPEAPPEIETPEIPPEIETPEAPPEIETPEVPAETESPEIPQEPPLEEIPASPPENEKDTVHVPKPPISESPGNSSSQKKTNNKTSNSRIQNSIPNPLKKQKSIKPTPLPKYESDNNIQPIKPISEEPKHENNIFHDDRFHKSYVTGFPDGNFRPNSFMTRAEMAQVFFNLSNEASKHSAVMNDKGFSDVSAEDWYYSAVSYFVNMGVLSGYPDGSFKPNQSITNAEFAAFSAIAFNLAQLDIENTLEKTGNHWAEFYLNASFDKRWFDFFGTDYQFHSDAYITRSQAVTLINFYTGRIANINDITTYLVKQIYNDTDRSHWAFYEIMEATIPHTYTRSGQSERMLFD
jgi:predicted outer membrane repeat protein